MLIATLTSCGTPDIAEVSDRLTVLIEGAYEVNGLLFGEGPATYERVSDPKAEMKYHQEAGGQRYYYFYFEDEAIGTMIAYKDKSYGDAYTYLLVKNEKVEGENEVYSDGERYFYAIDYTYVEKDFYYDESFPEDYDVIDLKGEITSIEQIKEEAEKIYSKDYLNSIYETLFTGVMLSEGSVEEVMTARYIEYEDASGTRWFMKSNTYKPLVYEVRRFDLDTAKMLRGSNKQRLRIEIESYLESSPDERISVVVNLVKQDGEWYLDNGTY